jgi:hypothetical protein
MKVREGMCGCVYQSKYSNMQELNIIDVFRNERGKIQK